MQRPLTINLANSRLRVPRPSTRVTAIAALLVGNTCFGLGTVATKGAMDGIPPLTLAAARFGIAACWSPSAGSRASRPSSMRGRCCSG